VFENLERQVVIQRPETHVYEKGKEPPQTQSGSGDSGLGGGSGTQMAMPSLLEDKLGQQVLIDV
jgi:hypothetical protein